MTTIKRPVAQLPNKGNSHNPRYLNQMNFAGIDQSSNFFEVNPLTFRDAKNVYVDDNKTLVSRPPIVTEELPIAYVLENGNSTQTPIVPLGFNLVDLYEFDELKIYVSKANGEYNIAIYNTVTLSLKVLPELVSSYHVTSIDNYILVFNDKNARVLNVNYYEEGWKLLSDVSEVPVVKRVVGQETYNYPKNNFTGSYKEEYVWSEGMVTMVPSGNAEVLVNQSPENLKWTLDDADINTEFRILRSLNIKYQLDDLVTMATNETTGIDVIAVARDNYVMLSYDNGQSFQKVLYPVNAGFLNIASLSKNALYFYFVAVDGVYRYTIGDNSWVVIRHSTPTNLIGIGVNNTCCFLNDEVFTFVLYEGGGTPVARIYWKGVGLTDNDDYPVNTLGVSVFTGNIDGFSQPFGARKDISLHSMQIVVDDGKTYIGAWLPSNNTSANRFVSILGQGDSTEAIVLSNNIFKPYGYITNMRVLTANPLNDDANPFRGLFVDCVTVNASDWVEAELVIGEEETSTDVWEAVANLNYLSTINQVVNYTSAPLSLVIAYISNINIYSVDGVARLPETLNGAPWPDTNIRHYTVVNKSHFLIIIGDTIYTNKLLSDSTAVLTYTYLSTEAYTEVPQVSHVNNELYLGIGNKLKITENLRDGENTLFNLPSINDHMFISSVNALLNISTTQVAIFLIDQVYIVVQVADELLGYRYDYYNTRLSVGVRAKDSVINTRDGMLTLYPTRQGLAVMNYQPDVTNTDQIVKYITEQIPKLWLEFYNAGSPIQLVQIRDHVILTNGTKDFLLLDLRGLTWWKLDSPVAIMKIVTDQNKFNIVSNALYKYKENATIYKDLNTRFIDWYIESQPLHFGLPNYYKTIKQLIYQFEQTNNINQTLLTQVKLYRKTLSTKEPEVIQFVVDNYRTFVKRFNYWKISEMQWGMGADRETVVPTQLKLNGISVKYEVSEEVR